MMRTQEALNLANEVIGRVDSHRLRAGEPRELAMTLAFAVKALALECEGLQSQVNCLTVNVDDVARAAKREREQAGADRAARWSEGALAMARRFAHVSRSHAL